MSGKREEVRKNVSEVAAYAAWNLGNWELFEQYVNYIEEDMQAYEKQFYKAIISIQKGSLSDAQKLIDRAREILDPKISSLIGESYSRAYSLVLEL